MDKIEEVYLIMNSGITIYELEQEYLFNEKNEYSSNEDISNGAFLLKILNNEKIINPYEKRIFLIYLEYGSLRKTERHTNIKYRWIGVIVKRVKNIIREEYVKANE